MKLEIIITPTGNPTPNRNWDWEAHVDGYEEDVSSLGATAQAALEALVEDLDGRLGEFVTLAKYETEKTREACNNNPDGVGEAMYG